MCSTGFGRGERKLYMPAYSGGTRASGSDIKYSAGAIPGASDGGFAVSVTAVGFVTPHAHKTARHKIKDAEIISFDINSPPRQ
jgi:hypothetical protein